MFTFRGVTALALTVCVLSLIMSRAEAADRVELKESVRDSLRRDAARTNIKPIKPKLMLKLPDLVVRSFRHVGRPYRLSDGRIVVPVRLTVYNKGAADAGKFKISAHVKSSKGTFTAAFSVPGQASKWYPWVNGLKKGSAKTLTGRIFLHKGNKPNMTVKLFAKVDSISGDEFMPKYGRVLEMSETNNFSDGLVFKLP